MFVPRNAHGAVRYNGRFMYVPNVIGGVKVVDNHTYQKKKIPQSDGMNCWSVNV